MKILGMEKLYKEAFANKIISIGNIEESCEQFFSSMLFRNYIDSRIMQTKLNYNEENDLLKLVVECYVDIPICNRYSKKVVLCNYYRKIKYIATYEKAKLVDETVEILD